MTTIDPNLMRDVAMRMRAMIGPLKGHKIYFVHIPKNAGTTVMRTLLNHAHGVCSHATAAQVNSIEWYADYDNFVFCRDPIDRFVSIYLWRLRKDELVQSLSMEELIELLEDSNINQPLPVWGFENDKSKLDRMFNRQVAWTNDKTVFVGRTEQTMQDVHFLIKKYNLFTDVPKETNQLVRNLNIRHNEAKLEGPQAFTTKIKLLNVLKDSKTLCNRFFDYYIKDYQEFGYNIPKELSQCM